MPRPAPQRKLCLPADCEACPDREGRAKCTRGEADTRRDTGRRRAKDVWCSSARWQHGRRRWYVQCSCASALAPAAIDGHLRTTTPPSAAVPLCVRGWIGGGVFGGITPRLAAFMRARQSTISPQGQETQRKRRGRTGSGEVRPEPNPSRLSASGEYALADETRSRGPEQSADLTSGQARSGSGHAAFATHVAQHLLPAPFAMQTLC